MADCSDLIDNMAMGKVSTRYHTCHIFTHKRFYIIIIIIIIIIWNFTTMDRMGECETMVGKMMASRMLKDNTILVWCSLFACIHVQLK